MRDGVGGGGLIVGPSPPAGLRRLLDAAFDDFGDDDWDHALGGTHVWIEEDGAVVSHASVVPRVLRVDGASLRSGYVEAVATAPSRQGTGLGSLVMAGIGRIIRREYKLGALSTGSHGFYERLGWERWLGPTFVGDVRTPDEDDGVMVLRLGPLDLGAPISCDPRPGDDW